MSAEFLKREEEYRKLNAELENRSKQLQQQADMVMKIQDLLPVETLKYISCAYEDVKPQRELTTQRIENEIKLNDVPDSVSEMGAKAITHFYRAKVKKLQEDLEKANVDFKAKTEEVRRLQKDNQKLNEDKDKWFQLSTSNKTHISKLENQIGALHSKLTGKENEKVTLKKENEQLQKDLKTTASNLSATELKLNRLNEELERVKLSLKTAKQEEKDLREAHRKEINEMTSIIKKIEKHRTELLNGFKKQLLLIDNLKRQKTHLESYKLVENADAEFMKLLDLKID